MNICWILGILALMPLARSAEPPPAATATTPPPAEVNVHTLPTAPEAPAAPINNGPLLYFFRGGDPLRRVKIAWDEAEAQRLRFRESKPPLWKLKGKTQAGDRLILGGQTAPEQEFEFPLELSGLQPTFSLTLERRGRPRLTERFAIDWLEAPPKNFAVNIREDNKLTSFRYEFDGIYPAARYIRPYWLRVTEGYRWWVGAGIESLSYGQTQQPSFSQVGLAVEARFRQPINRRLSLGLKFDGTAISMLSDRPATVPAVRLLAAEIHVSYYWTHGRWRFYPYGLGGYQTMLVSGGQYGITNLLSLGIGSRAEYSWDHHTSFFASAALAFTSSDTGFLSVANRRYRLAVGYAWRGAESTRTQELSLGYAFLPLSLSYAEANLHRFLLSYGTYL